MFEAYREYMGVLGTDARTRNIEIHKDELRRRALASPDYQPYAMRNGIVQPMILTRGGENHSYNIICMPDDELFAGDIIDVFGEKWLVMEARADMTTHKTGRMTQCNHLFRFQNFTSDIIECWGIIDQSGYSSSVTGTNQLQKSEEQVAIYLPYNQDTCKIFVDKRLASHVGYDQTGRLILNSYKVTSCSPNTNSYNRYDHLLMLKAVRDVYSESTDNVELEICDYIAPDASDDNPPSPPVDPTKLQCVIEGKPEIMLNRSRTLKAIFLDERGKVVADVQPAWSWEEMDGITVTVNEEELTIRASGQSKLIGSSFEVSLSDQNGLYQTESVTVEVTNFA